MTHQPDDALHLALRCLTHHRAALRHDHHARAAEVALAQWAHTCKLRLITAARSQHPLAQELRQHLRAAARARRHRDNLLPTLGTLAANTAQSARAKLRVARIFVDHDTPVGTLLASLARDLRRQC